MKTKAYCLLTAIIVAFAFSFPMYKTWIKLQDTRAKVQRFETEITQLRDSIDRIENAYSHEKNVRWVARALVSETDSIHEMPYKANVIRNRVENCFRGECTYREVILDPYQFSAFNEDYPLRERYVTLTDKNAQEYGVDDWQKAKKVSRWIITRYRHELPLPDSVLYYYSPMSMPDYKPKPMWIHRVKEFDVKTVKDKRFRYFMPKETSSVQNNTHYTAR